MKKITTILAGLILLIASNVWAIPSDLTLIFEYNGVTTTVADQSGADANTLPDIVAYGLPLGPQWLYNVTGGFIGNTLGSGVPQMLLASADTSLPSIQGDLVIRLLGTTGPWTGNGAFVEVDGNSNLGSATSFITKINNLEMSSLSFQNGVINGEDAFTVDPDSIYNIEMIATLTHAGFGNTAFAYRLTPAPEPGTLMLLGIGALTVAIYTKRRMNA